MKKYRPRFKPEVYLKFLNSQWSIAIEWTDYGYPSIRLFYIDEEGNQDEIKFCGDTIEECLDRIIESTEFEKELI